MLLILNNVESIPATDFEKLLSMFVDGRPLSVERELAILLMVPVVSTVVALDVTVVHGLRAKDTGQVRVPDRGGGHVRFRQGSFLVKNKELV
jgi:hypothetical protein